MNKRYLAAFSIILVCGVLLIWMMMSRTFRDRARLSEAKSIASALVNAESTFYKEWGQYTAKLDDAGFAPSSLPVKIYTDAASLPPDFREKLAPAELPLVEKDHYRFILARPCEESALACLIILTERDVILKNL